MTYEYIVHTYIQTLLVFNMLMWGLLRLTPIDIHTNAGVPYLYYNDGHGSKLRIVRLFARKSYGKNFRSIILAVRKVKHKLQLQTGRYKCNRLQI